MPKVTPLPDKDALLACFKFPEAADYFLEQFEKILKEAGGDVYKKSEPILNKIKDFVKNTHYQRDARGFPWDGDTQMRTDFQNLQHHLAEAAVRTITAIIKGIVKMDVAVSKAAQLLRGYSEEGMALKGVPVESLDKLFNAWLAENNYLSKGSVIYQTNEHGEIVKDKAGNPLRADPEKIMQLMADEKKGFGRFLQDRGLEVVVQQHQYPEQAQTADKRREAQDTAKKGKATPAPQETRPEVPSTAESPTSGGRMGG
ncbi:substrate of the Dot/Icm secretion system [Legionella rubrilucens]|uniref:Substrate of the Dot/Icm secretion system n=1 Tax=Legionella rubrilucens TaxID=458 RepID=A0A0W0XMD9_9GAMM|nr:hypothetical protein [Legionella rubrilucens]KTD45723.1 substrate of the Dot/Icm secretion system [Legionella rubrilucens]